MSDAWLDWSGARLDSSWQGIRFLQLEFLPDESAPTEALLTVFLNRPAAGMNAQSFRLSGGRRVQDLPWTLQSLVGAEAVLRIEGIGDHSDYTLTLLDGGSDPLHPFFSCSLFNFTLQCEKGDCHPATLTAPPLPRPRPNLDLLTKDYNGFVGLLADRVRVTNPHWADLAPASFERMLLELLSHHADHLSYYQDRVANEAFLDDASQRYSLRQHGRLLGYALDDGQAASTVLAFEVTKSGYLPSGLSVRMERAADEAPVVFYVPERARVVAEHNRLPPAAWPGAEDARLPAGADHLLLWGQDQQLRVGQRIAFVQGAFAQVVSITALELRSLPGWTAQTSDPPHTAESDLQELWFEPPLEQSVAPFRSDFRLYGNLATAVHGEERSVRLPLSAREIPENRDSDRVRVERSGGSVMLLRSLRVPDGPILFDVDDSGDAQPAFALRIGPAASSQPDLWYSVDALHSSRSFDRHYVATLDEDGSLWLQFGDGVAGMGLELADGSTPATQELTMRYRVGAAVAGNCAPNTLTRIDSPANAADRQLLGEIGPTFVTNVLPGRGGRPLESRDAARLAIPASLRHGTPQRAVTLEDYAAAARRVPGVSRAAARNLGGVFNTVLVLVDPDGQVELDVALKQSVWEQVDRLRMAGREHFIVAPEYVPLELVLALCVEPGAFPHRVRDAVTAALRPGSSRFPGYFHPDRLSFGEAVLLGEILAVVQGVPGVRSVKALTFRKLGVPSSGPVENKLSLSGAQVARLDADPDFPENGRLEVRVCGIDACLDEDAIKIADAGGSV